MLLITSTCRIYNMWALCDIVSSSKNKFFRRNIQPERIYLNNLLQGFVFAIQREYVSKRSLFSYHTCIVVMEMKTMLKQEKKLVDRIFSFLS